MFYEDARKLPTAILEAELESRNHKARALPEIKGEAMSAAALLPTDWMD